jgi:hypothetical protein
VLPACAILLSSPYNLFKTHSPKSTLVKTEELVLDAKLITSLIFFIQSLSTFNLKLMTLFIQLISRQMKSHHFLFFFTVISLFYSYVKVDRFERHRQNSSDQNDLTLDKVHNLLSLILRLACRQIMR